MSQYGTSLVDLDEATIERAVGDLLDGMALDLAEPIVVMPDAHYPYHPSTGLVTNPKTVAAVLAWLDDQGYEDVTVGVVGSDAVRGAQAASVLGYDRLAEAYDVEVVDLDTEPHVRQSTTVVDESVSLDVPERLLDATLLSVPTIRTTEESGLVSACVSLLRATGTDRVTARRVAAAVDLLAPACTLVDGTYAYSGGARASRVLLVGDDPVVLDVTLAEALDYDAAPYLEDLRHITSTAIEGLDAETLADTLPGGEPDPDPAGPSPAMKTGYKLYAKLTGDGVPPMLLGGE
jgi:uncharacterized protein (DUF362 family)